MLRYLLTYLLHVITWRHDVTEITTWRQETNCLHLSLQMGSRADFIFVSVISLVTELKLIIVVVFAWWTNVMKWRHNAITLLNMLYLSQLVDVLEIWLFFVCIVLLWVAKFKNIINFVILICGQVTKWCYDVMAWLYDVTKLTPSILTCVVTRQMILSLPVYTCLFRLLNQEMSLLNQEMS